MSTSEEKKITLKSCDEAIFEVDEVVAMQMQTIKHMIEDDCVTNAIPLPNVHGKILSKVVEYCKNHVQGHGDDEDSTTNKKKEDELKALDAELVKLDMDTLFELITAANYLHVKGLLDLSCQTMADMIKDKTPEEVRKFFNIENDFTPEEEAEIRKANQWAFEE